MAHGVTDILRNLQGITKNNSNCCSTFQVSDRSMSYCTYCLAAVGASSGGYPRTSACILEQSKGIYDGEMVSLQHPSTEGVGFGITSSTHGRSR